MLEFELLHRHLFQFSIHNPHFEILFTVWTFSAERAKGLLAIFFDALFAEKDVALVALVGVYRDVETHNAAESVKNFRTFAHLTLL